MEIIFMENNTLKLTFLLLCQTISQFFSKIFYLAIPSLFNSL